MLRVDASQQEAQAGKTWKEGHVLVWGSTPVAGQLEQGACERGLEPR